MSGPTPQSARSRRARRARDSRDVVAKVACPWCGSLNSIVAKSEAPGVRSLEDGYRRRRQCAECVDDAGRPRTWPTIERTDWRRFARELETAGLTFEDLGIMVVEP